MKLDHKIEIDQLLFDTDIKCLVRSNKTNKVIPSDQISAFIRSSKESLVLFDKSNSGAMNGVVPMQIIKMKIQVTLDISNLKRTRKNFLNIKTSTYQKAGFGNTCSFLETNLLQFFTIKTWKFKRTRCCCWACTSRLFIF